MKVKSLLYMLMLGAFISTLFSCASIPEGAVAVKPFEKKRYLGKWHEIARKDFKFERNLSNVTAEYSLNDNGTIKVVNRGYNTQKEKWSQVVGKAKFAGEEDVAMLKVSFFGPFYSGYNVIALDDEYQYALVAGKNLDYLWILARQKEIPSAIKDKYLAIAEQIGFDTSDLIWVAHDQ